MESKVKEYLSQEELKGKAHFTGWIPHDELPKYLNELRLLVLHSSTEGLPNIVLEAMACGCPVLASDKTSLPEVGGDAVQYFDPVDSDVMAVVLHEVLSDENLRKKLSRKGYDRVEEFRWSAIIPRMEQLYSDQLQ